MTGSAPTPEPIPAGELRPLTRRQRLLQYLPFLLAGAALIALVLLLTYLQVFGRLGYDVSSLDAGGPQWPFTVAWFLAVGTVGSFLLGVVWTPLVAVRFSRAGHRIG